MAIDGNTNKVVEDIAVGKEPHIIAVNPKIDYIYVVNTCDGSVSSIKMSVMLRDMLLTIGRKRAKINLSL